MPPQTAMQCSRPDTREPGFEVPQESAQATAKPVPALCRDTVKDKNGGFKKVRAEQPRGLLSGISPQEQGRKRQECGRVQPSCGNRR